MDQPLMTIDLHTEIREEVRKLCAKFPGEYWRKLDQVRGYPTEFINALTQLGESGLEFDEIIVRWRIGSGQQ